MKYTVNILGCVKAEVDEVIDLFQATAPVQVHDWALRVLAHMNDLSLFPHRNPATGSKDARGNPVRQTLFGKRRGAWIITYSVDDSQHLVVVYSIRRAGRGPISLSNLA